MMAPRTKQPSAKRLPYEKPVLRSISLVADQVLGNNCKGPTSIDNTFGQPGVNCYLKACKLQIGS